MSTKSDKTNCPFCKEEIHPDAVKCKHCLSEIVNHEPVHEGVCPFCKEEIKVGAILCKHCKSDLRPDSGHSRSSSGCGCGSSSQIDFATYEMISKIGGFKQPAPDLPVNVLKDNDTTSGTKTICFPCVPDSGLGALLGIGRRWCFERTYKKNGGFSDGAMYQQTCNLRPSLSEILADPTYPYPG